MEYFSEHQSEFGLFQRIQSYLRVVKFAFLSHSCSSPSSSMSLEWIPIEICFHRSKIACWRSERVDCTPSCARLGKQRKRSRLQPRWRVKHWRSVLAIPTSLCRPCTTLFFCWNTRNTSLQKVSGASGSWVVLESIYYDIELLTKEHKYILHFIVALYSYDVLPCLFLHCRLIWVFCCEASSPPQRWSSRGLFGSLTRFERIDRPMFLRWMFPLCTQQRSLGSGGRVTVG